MGNAHLVEFANARVHHLFEQPLGSGRDITHSIGARLQPAFEVAVRLCGKDLRRLVPVVDNRFEPCLVDVVICADPFDHGGHSFALPHLREAFRVALVGEYVRRL